MQEQTIWFLENIDVKGIFCPNKVGDIEDAHILKQFEKGSYIYMPEQSSDEETTCCILTVDEMKSLMKDHSKLSLFFMKMMGSRVLEMEHRLESLVFKDSRSRIVEFLVDLAEKKGQRVGYEWVVRKFITHQEIANLTATSRQTVTTVLNELRNDNLLTFNRKRLLIRDLDKLKEEIR